jgi:hypothetical protein
MNDMPLLKVGRHFRLESDDKVIVARNEQECNKLKSLCSDTDHLLFPLDFPGPVVILQGKSLEAAVERMLRYTKRHVPPAARIEHRYGGKTEVVYLEDMACETPKAYEMKR